MSRWLKLPVFLSLILLLLTASYALQRRMNAVREAENLVATGVVENAPPIVAFTTVALGSFRGLVADLLWFRLQRKQEQGSYFEMVQLASWITKLQPRFTGATAFLAWNMAYNISVTFNSPADRWRWVQRGIELIRDEALVYNPSDPILFKELGWIYQHKLGQEMDDANLYYKWQLAREMMETFGSYPIDWQAWAAVPVTHELFLASLGVECAKLRTLISTVGSLDVLETAFWDRGGSFADNVAIAELTEYEKNVLERFLRVRRLRNGLKLDPAMMARIDAEYGDFDWRLPEAHAIYWATRGLESSPGGTEISCERMIFQSLHAAFIGGRLLYMELGEEEMPILQFIPNVNIADAVNRAYHVSLEQHSSNDSIKNSHKNFLRNAIVFLFTFSREDKALAYYQELGTRYPNPAFKKPLDYFVIEELEGDVGTANYNQGQGLVQGYLWQTCYNLALGEFERAAAMQRIAARIWARYMETIGSDTHNRRGLAPFAEMRENAFRQCLMTFPPALASRLRTAAFEVEGVQDIRDFPGTDKGDSLESPSGGALQ